MSGAEARGLSGPRSRDAASLWRAGNGACAGCGMSLGLQWLDEALGDERPMMVVPACCASVTPGSYPSTAFGVPAVATTFASCAAVGTGVSRVRRLNAEPEPTVCWAGDGGTYDIGMATLSAAAERNEDMIYVCYDNEIYGNTGGQRSSATQAGARTSTTRAGKREPKKDIMAIMAAHRVPYAATLSLAHRDDFLRKLKTARRLSGFRFLLLLSPCPAGWKSDPAQGVDLVRKAVASGLFPLYEVFDGRSYRVNAHPDGTPLEDYLSGQGRFRSKALDVGALRAGVAEQWSFLDQMEKSFPAADVDVHGPGGPDIAGDDAACAARWVMSVAVEDQPGVLSRVVGQFSRRSVNIGSLVVRAADDAGLSVITIAFDAGDQTAERLLGSVDKLVDVVWVTLPGVASARGRGRRPAARRGETCRRAR